MTSPPEFVIVFEEQMLHQRHQDLRCLQRHHQYYSLTFQPDLLRGEQRPPVVVRRLCRSTKSLLLKTP